MSVLTAQTVTAAGLTPAYTPASAGGDSIQLTPNAFLHVKNGSGAAVTVTFPTVNNQIAGHTIADVTVSVPAGGERMIGPIHPAYHGNINGQAAVTYSAVTSVTVAALRI